MKLIGTKDFYRSLFKIAIPIMVQNAITNMVGLVNNITVGSLGTEQLAGVAIAKITDDDAEETMGIMQMHAR